MTSTYIASGGCDLSKPSPDDDPLSDLKQLEFNLKDGISRLFLLNLPLINSLARDGVDIETDRMLHNISDVIDDHLGLEMMRLENE
jgi:hypothetical protein